MLLAALEQWYLSLIFSLRISTNYFCTHQNNFFETSNSLREELALQQVSVGKTSPSWHGPAEPPHRHQHQGVFWDCSVRSGQTLLSLKAAATRSSAVAVGNGLPNHPSPWMRQNDAVQLRRVRGPNSDSGKRSSGAEDEAAGQGSASGPRSRAGGWEGPIREVSVAPKGVSQRRKGLRWICIITFSIRQGARTWHN